jgi:hypothetical protein
MSTTATATNPFALIMDPDAVLQAMEHSDALRSLKLRRIQPLDEMPMARKGAVAAVIDKDIDQANFPLWRDLISSTDPDFFSQLFN